MGIPKKKAKRPKNRQTKTTLVWDDKLRADYLTGFRKRKAERKKYHQEKLKKRMIEERKDLKRQAREMMKKKLNQDKGFVVPEVEHLVDATEFDLPNHTVTITDITEVDFSSEGGLRLGQNLIPDEGEKEDKKVKHNKADERRLASLKRKLQKCGNVDKKRKPKFSSAKHAKHHLKGGRKKEKKKFKKRNTSS